MTVGQRLTEHRFGETVDLEARFVSYGSPLSTTGAVVICHAVTNGMAAGISLQATGSVGRANSPGDATNGWVTARIDTDRYLPCLALYMVLAWRVMYVMMLSRECPDMSCAEVFSEAEWKSVYVVVCQEQPPAEPPHRGLERRWLPVRQKRQNFAIEDQFLRRQLAHRLHHLGHGSCDVVQQARKHHYLVARTVSLHARTVQLEFERRRFAQLLERLPQAGDVAVVNYTGACEGKPIIELAPTAKGLTEQVVLLRHALANAAVPIVTVIGIGVALLIGGVVVTETVYAIPGLGMLTVDAVLNRDFPVIQGLVLLFSCAYVFINLMVDLSYLFLDPRIRY